MPQKLDPLSVRIRDKLAARKRHGSLRSLRRLDDKRDGPLEEFSSNDYLDLSTSPVLRERFLHYLNRQSLLASTGSRLLSGNNPLAEIIEVEAAKYFECETTLLCASGYEANVSIFSTLPQPGDLIIYDELIHASVHVGMRASRTSERVAMRHSDCCHLRSLLRREAHRAEENGETSPQRTVFLAIETVYSMDGDVAPLAEILEVVREELPSVRLIVDEAHATGVFGQLGEGLAVRLGLRNAPEVLVRLHTLGKGAGGTGAIVVCDTLIKHYLLNYAKGLIYSTYMSIPALCLARAAIYMLSSGQTASANIRLWRNIEYLKGLLHAIPSTSLLEIPHSVHSPIVPICSEKAVKLSIFLEERGFRILPVRYPTVAKGTERVRICLRADISTQVIDRVVASITEWIAAETASRLHDSAGDSLVGAVKL